MLRDPRNSRYWQAANSIAILVGSYAIWTLLFRLAGLTLVIYFLTHTSGTSGKAVLFEEVNETFGAHELSFVGFGALGFLLLFKGFSPLWRENHVKILSLRDLQKSFIPGFVQGALLASALIGALLLSGSYRFVGFFVQLEETPLAILGICMRTLSIFALCYCEEWIFRKKAFEFSTETTFQQSMTKILWISVAYAAIKFIQFELGWMHLVTVFLVSVTLSIRQLNDRNFTRGAGFWCGLLVIFQPVFSLPLLGNDFSGVFLVKYQAPSTALRLFSGGEGGPLAGFAFQFLLLIEILRSVITFRKSIR